MKRTKTNFEIGLDFKGQENLLKKSLEKNLGCKVLEINVYSDSRLDKLEDGFTRYTAKIQLEKELSEKDSKYLFRYFFNKLGSGVNYSTIGNF